MRASSAHGNVGSPVAPPLSHVVVEWLHVFKLWFIGEERWRARMLAAATLVGSALHTALLVQVSYAQKDMSTALADKKPAAFYQAVWQFVLIIVVAIPLFAFKDFLEQRCIIEWRNYLTSTLLKARHVAACSSAAPHPRTQGSRYLFRATSTAGPSTCSR